MQLPFAVKARFVSGNDNDIQLLITSNNKIRIVENEICLRIVFDNSCAKYVIAFLRKAYTVYVRPITVWTVVQAVLTATSNSYGDRQISTPYKINTPEPIDKKFGTVDYVREGTQYTKFDTNPPTGGFWANGWNITKIIFYLYLFFSGTRTGQTRGWIFTRDSSKDVKSRKDVPFGGLNDVPLNFGGKTPKKT